MPYPDYESELYPIRHEPQDFDCEKAELLRLPTEELRKEYDRINERLMVLREKEPVKKRGQKAVYRVWVMQTHDLLDLLNEIANELHSRSVV